MTNIKDNGGYFFVLSVVEIHSYLPATYVLYYRFLPNRGVWQILDPDFLDSDRGNGHW